MALEAALDINCPAYDKAPSPINLDVLQKRLQNNNQVDTFILWSGFKYGFRLSYRGECKARL